MTQQMHTPGPWSVFYKHKYDEWHVSVPLESGGMKLGLFLDGCPTGEHDARLIAASPEMGGIIKRLIQWDIDYPVNCHNGYAGLKELNRIIADGKAVLAKLEGSRP